MHNVDAAVTISGAPGGNRLRVAEQAGATWATLFTCASCHAPHGSHSIRLLHANPNDVAVRATISAAVYDVPGGRYTVSVATNVYMYIYTTGIQDVTGAIYHTYTLQGTPAALALIAAPWVSGYTEAYTVAAVRTPAFWTRIYHTAWNPNTIVHGVYGTVYADPTSTAWTAASLGNMLTRHFIINFATGTVMQTPAQRAALIDALQAEPFGLSPEDAAVAPLRIDVARGLQVRARAAAVYQPGTVGGLVYGARQIDFIDPASYDGPAYNLFCAACHTDYLPLITAGAQTRDLDGGETVADGVGLYSEKFRHTINRGASAGVSPMPVTGGTEFTGANLTGSTVGRNRLMCVSCHFAHGADASMMLLADNTRISAGVDVPGAVNDINQNDVSAGLGIGGSSALKRYINQASCWHCHVRSAATVFHNTDYFWTMFPQGAPW